MTLRMRSNTNSDSSNPSKPNMAMQHFKWTAHLQMCPDSSSWQVQQFMQHCVSLSLS
jgi:hypothetical protein